MWGSWGDREAGEAGKRDGDGSRQGSRKAGWGGKEGRQKSREADWGGKEGRRGSREAGEAGGEAGEAGKVMLVTLVTPANILSRAISVATSRDRVPLGVSPGEPLPPDLMTPPRPPQAPGKGAVHGQRGRERERERVQYSYVQNRCITYNRSVKGIIQVINGGVVVSGE